MSPSLTDGNSAAGWTGLNLLNELSTHRSQTWVHREPSSPSENWHNQHEVTQRPPTSRFLAYTTHVTGWEFLRALSASITVPLSWLWQARRPKAKLVSFHFDSAQEYCRCYIQHLNANVRKHFCWYTVFVCQSVSQSRPPACTKTFIFITDQSCRMNYQSSGIRPRFASLFGLHLHLYPVKAEKLLTFLLHHCRVLGAESEYSFADTRWTWGYGCGASPVLGGIVFWSPVMYPPPVFPRHIDSIANCWWQFTSGRLQYLMR